MSTALQPKFPLLATACALALVPSVHAEVAQSAVELDTVVVTAAGYEQTLAEAPASMTVITREELALREVRSLTDALRGIEGINISGLDARDGKTGNQSISLRGLPREYTLVLIDGVRQNPRGNVTPNSFNDSQSVFIPPVSAIERIEVIRGPMSTLYGSDALGGVVNIITRRPGDAWTGSGSLGHTFQSDSDFGDTSALDIHAAGPLARDRLSLQLFGRAFDRQRSDIDIPGVEQPRPITADTPTMGQNPVAARVYTIGSRLNFTPTQDHDLSLTASRTEQSYDNRSGDVGALHRTGNPATSACNTLPVPNLCRGYDTELGFNRSQFSLEHVGRLAFGTLNTRLTRDEIETLGRTIPLNSGLDPVLEGSPRTLELRSSIFDTSLQTSVGNSLLTLGGQYIDPKLSDGLTGGGALRVSQYSVFVENEWQATDRFSLTSGLRYDDNQAFSGEWTPRVYGVWRASDSWIIKGGAGRGFRAPNVEQLTDGIIGFGNQGTVPIFGNPELAPEKSTNVELSALYSGAAISAQGTVFRNEVANLIESGTGANAGRALNIGEARLQGVELAASAALGPDFRLSGNYSFTDSEVTRTQLDTGDPAQLVASRLGDPLVSVPRHMANLRLDWTLSADWSAFVANEYRSSAFRPRNFHEPQTGGNSQGQVGAGERDSREVIGDFRGYSLLNLGMAWRINDTLSLTGVIYNLLDRDFQDYIDYDRCSNAGCNNAPGSATGFSNRYNTIQEPRRFWLSLTATF